MNEPKLSLTQARERIDSIDRQIQELISERANWAREVAKVKGEGLSAIDYYRPEREAHVLRMVVDRNHGPLSDGEMVRLFREIMSSCLAQEDPLKVGYLGPEGTFSEQAVRKHFGHAAYGLPLGSIEEVFQEVAAGHADFGVVPVENSGQGMIQVTLDMFLTSEARICGEVELRVHQCLLSQHNAVEGIKRVYGHAQSLQQCKTWLRVNLPDAECIPVQSNAEGARLARDVQDAAAIAGATAAKVYGLHIVAQAIEDRADNTTRFLVIGRSLFPASGNDRTSLLITVNDKPGALYEILSPFAKHGISLNRIESRPAHTGKWQYAFFIDVSGHIDDVALQTALKDMGPVAAQVRVLGAYPVALP
ncbi:prephenate dehydratase [Dyella monticola]|uniref:Bifunctional chorismate mutase/prephenate dehydratase n=1 Tax=Dyella monticola TaxID=1927958 RepID=A0A370X6B0_9GAMM|nr:prephenate dehydratase [Dyella monticola]RDS83807.1 prephenate dehydratase [Dyella monticola]